MSAPLPKLVLDIFAGGGGASTGIRNALGVEVAVALNHCPAALAMHAANHPGTYHAKADVTLANPRALTQDRPVALIWFSPDCTPRGPAGGHRLFRRRGRVHALGHGQRGHGSPGWGLCSMKKKVKKGKLKVTFEQSDFVVARVLYEDARVMTLEIVKDKNDPIHLAQGLPGGEDAAPDRFFTMLFTDGTPWEKPAPGEKGRYVQ